MRATLQVFESQALDLDRFATFLEHANALRGTPAADGSSPDGSRIEAFRSATASLTSIAYRRATYNTIVISIYGALERFVEDLVHAYVRYLNAVTPTYADLPQPVLDNHLPLTVELLGQLDRPRYQGQGDRLVANLDSCLQQRPNYRLNALAFSLHTRNFKAAVIGDTLKRVGVEASLDSVKASAEYRAAVSAIDPGAPPTFNRFDEFVDRRNEVAHGTEADELLAVPLLRDYVQLVLAFCRALHARVWSDALKHLAGLHGQPLGKPLRVLRSGSIVTFDLERGKVEVNDVIVLLRHDGSCHAGLIEELRVSDAAAQSVDAAGGTQPVGAKLDVVARNADRLVLLPRVDPIAPAWEAELGF